MTSTRRCSITESGLKVDDMYYLPEDGELALMLARAKRSRRSVTVHYDENCTDVVHVADPVTGAWSRWRLQSVVVGTPTPVCDSPESST
jgi:hypothetical protein